MIRVLHMFKVQKYLRAERRKTPECSVNTKREVVAQDTSEVHDTVSIVMYEYPHVFMRYFY